MYKKNVLMLLSLVALSSLHAADIDGRIEQGEYPSSQILKKDVFTLHWRVDGDRIHMAIEATSRGWVAVGFDPEAVMSKSDMIFGFVGTDGRTTAMDAWSTGMFGPHPADTDQGGSNDILAYAGARTGDKVVFEFTRLLDTKDRSDKIIAMDKAMKVIWATGPDGTSTSRHDKVGSAKVAFGGTK